MTENLRLVGPIALTSTDSNTSSDFMLIASGTKEWCYKQTADCINQAMLYDTGSSKYGVYYNWYAATAGSGTIESTTPQLETQYSICPKNWGLPSGGSNGQTANLISLYNNFNSITSSPVSLVLSGNKSETDPNNNIGRFGRWWTKTILNETYTIYLGIDAGDTAVKRGGYYKYSGYSIRCSVL